MCIRNDKNLSYNTCGSTVIAWSEDKVWTPYLTELNAEIAKILQVVSEWLDLGYSDRIISKI